ncbi:MAG: hypothetical protein H7196_04515 [candidate division SR1 bacterium]|nr:hypothetical protein [candidate division SR1 bacterium]
MRNYRYLIALIISIAVASPISVKARPNVLDRVDEFDVCHYTTQSDYDEVRQNGIYSYQLYAIARSLKNTQNCYIYNVPANPSTFVTGYSDSNQIRLRWATQDEISYARSNLKFFRFLKDGTTRARFD